MNDEPRSDGGVATEPELKRGPLQRWVAKSIDDPQRVYRAMFYVATIFFLITTLFPFYFLLVLGVTPENVPLAVVPAAVDFSVFVEVFRQVDFLRYMVNSLVLALTTTAVVLLLSSLAGYVFGRLEFPGRAPLMLIVLAISYFPPAAFFLPLYRLFTGNVFPWLELYNTPGSMVLPFSSLFMPLSIFILTTFYGQIPDGLEDAARVVPSMRAASSSPSGIWP